MHFLSTRPLYSSRLRLQKKSLVDQLPLRWNLLKTVLGTTTYLNRWSYCNSSSGVISFYGVDFEIRGKEIDYFVSAQTWETRVKLHPLWEWRPLVWADRTPRRAEGGTPSWSWSGWCRGGGLPGLPWCWNPAPGCSSWYPPRKWFGRESHWPLTKLTWCFSNSNRQIWSLHLENSRAQNFYTCRHRVLSLIKSYVKVFSPLIKIKWFVNKKCGHTFMIKYFLGKIILPM